MTGIHFNRHYMSIMWGDILQSILEHTYEENILLTYTPKQNYVGDILFDKVYSQ